MNRAAVLYHPSWQPARAAVTHNDDDIAAWWATLDKIDRRYLIARANLARSMAALQWIDLMPQHQRAVVDAAHHAALRMSDRRALI